MANYIIHVEITNYGYSIRIESKTDKILKEYEAGNYKLDSNRWVEFDHPMALPLDKLIIYAASTTREMIDELEKEK